MLSDKAKIMMLEKIKPFLQSDYQSFINGEIKRLTPMKPDIDPNEVDKEMGIVMCPKCQHVICTLGEIEDWKEFYDFSVEPVVYCQICSQSIDIDEIANKNPINRKENP